MTGIAIRVTAALMVVAGVIAAGALADTSPTPSPQTGGFGGRPAAYRLQLDTDAEAGAMKQVPCAAGARLGTRCYVSLTQADATR